MVRIYNGIIVFSINLSRIFSQNRSGFWLGYLGIEVEGDAPFCFALASQSDREREFVTDERYQADDVFGPPADGGRGAGSSQE